MKDGRVWQGVRMRDVAAGTDPDAPPRTCTVPAAWDDAAAAALAALAPGGGRIALPRAAGTWIRPLASRARLTGAPELGDALHEMLLRRRAAPTAAMWRQGQPGQQPGPLGYVLNLPAFHDGLAGFDVAAFGDAVETVATALRLADPAAAGFAIAMADLDGLLAGLGLDYDSDAARDVARCLAALLRARADSALAGEQPDLLCALPGWPLPPGSCVVPGLAEAARAARAEACRHAGGRPSTAILPPGPAEALLGVETGGIAPAFLPVREDGGLTRAALARLAANGLSPEAALAALLRGDSLLAPAPPGAHLAMHDAVAPFVHVMPPRPVGIPVPARPATPRRELPARRRGHTQKASIGGHRVYLRTGEYEDGTLGEVEVILPRESPALRALVDAVAASVSLGLQHGVALDDYVTAYALTRFAPAGMVEGDTEVGYATSVLDWMVRHLAAVYLGGCQIPEAVPEAVPPQDTAPLLPLDLPAHPRARRLGLRLVANQ